jgi:hypothetical protein
MASDLPLGPSHDDVSDDLDHDLPSEDYRVSSSDDSDTESGSNDDEQEVCPVILTMSAKLMHFISHQLPETTNPNSRVIYTFPPDVYLYELLL